MACFSTCELTSVTCPISFLWASLACVPYILHTAVADACARLCLHSLMIEGVANFAFGVFFLPRGPSVQIIASRHSRLVNIVTETMVLHAQAMPFSTCSCQGSEEAPRWDDFLLRATPHRPSEPEPIDDEVTRPWPFLTAVPRRPSESETIGDEVA